MKKRLTVYFEGHVQGVGFRYETQKLAAGYDVAGTVENLDDGRVLLVGEGEEEELRIFLADLMKSHLGPHVRRYEEGWDEARGGLAGFRIAR
ncbi:MAG: acylphosphatase [Verrucomicrobium sp.]|nr:acylphosphatase [Verrucomicrobium sp.]